MAWHWLLFKWFLLRLHCTVDGQDRGSCRWTSCAKQQVLPSVVSLNGNGNRLPAAAPTAFAASVASAVVLLFSCPPFPSSALVCHVACACCMRVAINIAGAPRTSLRVECYKYLLAVYFARCRCRSRCRFVIFAGKYYHSARRICICQCIIHKHSHIQGCIDTSWGNEVRQIPFIVLHGDLLEGD